VRLAWRVLAGGQAPVQFGSLLDATLSDFLSEGVEGSQSLAWQSMLDRTRDKPWPTRREDLSNALSAWRTNPLARRMVNLTRDHVWGRGIRPISKNKTVQKWLDRFWDHDLNMMDERMPVWIDALTTDGELFPTFHLNPVDGMTYLRAIPAVQIQVLEWKANDYEQLTRFGQKAPGQIELVWWPAITEAEASQSSMWHYAVNRPLGVVRGDGDLTPALPWLAFYSDWLEDRVERNAALSKFYYEVAVENAADVPDAQQRYKSPPADGTVVVHSASEKHEVKQPKIGADDAQADGFALKAMVGVGGNVPVFWLGDVGQGNTEATSANMVDVSYRHYETRQAFVRRRIEHICRLAYERAAAAGSVRRFNDLQLSTSVVDISREDNKKLAESARGIAEAFATMVREGLDRDKRLVRLIYRFAGEDLDEGEIAEIVARAEGRAGDSSRTKETRTDGGSDDAE